MKKFFRRGKGIEFLFLFFALASVFFLAGIVVVLFSSGLLILRTVTLREFILGRYWHPLFYEPPAYGILPIILGSFWVTLGAMCIAIPLGVGAAVYIAEVASPQLKEILKPVIELLGAIPSVVYGFFGVVALAPFIMRLFDLPIGFTALTASILLGLMALPTIVTISEDVISSVPVLYREASYALGATKLETAAKVVFPAAFPGIVTAIILGMGRAIGETMVVMMVAGGSAIIPRSFLQPVRAMTATIGLEMGEAASGSPHMHALFGIGCVLFVLTLLFSIAAERFSIRFRRQVGI
ncbi:phosphate ABC transporter permease subunit PstC [bacterium Unc6]|nr:phosphate ABC transporter permease subunit PstC [bacterium Unc6]MBT9130710.1 Phosphate transport system permease protein PstC [Candidatus Psychracetigena formicireducens]